MTRTVQVTSDQVAAARALRQLLGADQTPPAVSKIADADIAVVPPSPAAERTDRPTLPAAARATETDETATASGGSRWWSGEAAVRHGAVVLSDWMSHKSTLLGLEGPGAQGPTVAMVVFPFADRRTVDEELPVGEEHGLRRSGHVWACVREDAVVVDPSDEVTYAVVTDVLRKLHAGDAK